VLGKELLEFRHTQGLSREQLARKIGSPGRRTRAFVEDLREAERHPSSHISRHIVDCLDKAQLNTKKTTTTRNTKVPIKKALYDDLIRILGISEAEFLTSYEATTTAGGGVVVSGNTCTLLMSVRRGWWSEYIKSLESKGFDRKYIADFAGVEYHKITAVTSGNCKLSATARSLLLDLAHKKPNTGPAFKVVKSKPVEIPKQTSAKRHYRIRLVTEEYRDYLRCGGKPLTHLDDLTKKTVVVTADEKQKVDQFRHAWWSPVIARLISEYGLAGLAARTSRSVRAAELWRDGSTVPGRKIIPIFLDLYDGLDTDVVPTPVLPKTRTVAVKASAHKDLRNDLMSALDAYLLSHMQKNERAVADRVVTEALDLITDEVNRQVEKKVNEKMESLKSAFRALF